MTISKPSKTLCLHDSFRYITWAVTPVRALWADLWINATDGNPETFWHSPYGKDDSTMQHAKSGPV